MRAARLAEAGRGTAWLAGGCHGALVLAVSQRRAQNS